MSTTKRHADEAAGEGGEEDPGQHQARRPPSGRRRSCGTARGATPSAVSRSCRPLAAKNSRSRAAHAASRASFAPSTSREAKPRPMTRPFEQGQPGAGERWDRRPCARPSGRPARRGRCRPPRRRRRPPAPWARAARRRRSTITSAVHLAGDVDRAVQGGDVGQGLTGDDHVPADPHELLAAGASPPPGAAPARRGTGDAAAGAAARKRSAVATISRRPWYARPEDKRSRVELEETAGSTGRRAPPVSGRRAVDGRRRRTRETSRRLRQSTRKPKAPRLTGEEITSSTTSPSPFQEAPSRPAPARVEARSMPPTAARAPNPRWRDAGAGDQQGGGEPPSSTITAAVKRQARGERPPSRRRQRRHHRVRGSPGGTARAEPGSRPPEGEDLLALAPALGAGGQVLVQKRPLARRRACRRRPDSTIHGRCCGRACFMTCPSRTAVNRSESPAASP